MKYFNQFHKESTERSLKSLEESRKLPVDLEAELKRHAEMRVKAQQIEEEYLRRKQEEREKEN